MTMTLGRESILLQSQMAQAAFQILDLVHLKHEVVGIGQFPEQWQNIFCIVNYAAGEIEREMLIIGAPVIVHVTMHQPLADLLDPPCQRKIIGEQVEMPIIMLVL